MDFFKWLASQPKMTDPHANAQALMAGTRMFGNNANVADVVGGYDPNGADLMGNNTPLIDPNKLSQGGYEPPLPALQGATPETNTYGTADLTSDYVNDLTKLPPAPVNNSTFTPTDATGYPTSLLNSVVNPAPVYRDVTPERVMNDIKSQAELPNGERIGVEPAYKVPPAEVVAPKAVDVVEQAMNNPSMMAIQPLMERYGGNRDMALIAKQMSPELVDALLSTYGVRWKDQLSDHLKQFLKDNNAW